MKISFGQISGATAFVVCLLLVAVSTNAQPSNVSDKPDQPNPIVHERKSGDFILRDYEDDYTEPAKDIDIDGDGDPDIDSASPEGYEDLINKLLDNSNVIIDYEPQTEE